MVSRRGESPVRPIRALFDFESVGGLTDDELVERFLSGDGEVGGVAFEVLIRRHGPMVHGACLCILRDRHEAEDAFQATFLVFARKAGSIRQRGSLAPWLLGVARRASTRLKARGARRRALPERLAHESCGSASSPLPDIGRRDEVAGLLEEIGRLPPRLQTPVLLCYREGMSYEDAARTLGVTEGAIRGRLARARNQLRSRLVRRGLAPDGALPAPVVATLKVSLAMVPAALIDSTIRCAIPVGSSPATVAGSAFRSAWKLSEEVVKAMHYSKIKGVTVAILGACLAAGAGAVVLARGEPAVVARAAGQVSPPTPSGDLGKLQGTWVRISTESGGQSRLLPKDQRNQLSIKGSRFRFSAESAAGEAALIKPDQAPKEIDLTPQGEEAGPLQGKTYYGLYELEGDTLMLCLDIYHKSERPIGFATKAGDRLVIDLYKRVGP